MQCDILEMVGVMRGKEIAGTTKQIAIYNEQTGAVFGVDLFEQESGAVVNMEFQN